MYDFEEEPEELEFPEEPEEPEFSEAAEMRGGRQFTAAEEARIALKAIGFEKKQDSGTKN